MPIQATVETMVVGDNTRACRLPHHEAAFIAGRNAPRGHSTVLLIEEIAPDPGLNEVVIDVNHTTVLSLSGRDDAILVYLPATEDTVGSDRSERGPNEASTTNDDRFRRELARVPSIEAVGNSLLAAVRKEHGGWFDRYQRGNGNYGLFVQRPDNFWTVTVQPRVRSLKITVRGEPKMFDDFEFELKHDQHGYSRFKVVKMEELSDALALLQRAAERV